MNPSYGNYDQNPPQMYGGPPGGGKAGPPGPGMGPPPGTQPRGPPGLGQFPGAMAPPVSGQFPGAMPPPGSGQFPGAMAPPRMGQPPVGGGQYPPGPGMSPQGMNQPPLGAPNMGGQGPPNPSGQMMYNGQHGHPGQVGGPIQNGVQTGPTGDPGLSGPQPMRPPGPSTNQLSSQMGGMSLSPQGLPPSSQGPPSGLPRMSTSGPSIMLGTRPAAPPASQYGGPPTSQYGAPPTSQHGGPPTSQYGGPPTSQHGGPPTSQYGGPPTSQHGGPPTSQYGGPPTSQYGGQPPSQMSVPPTSQGQHGARFPPPQPGPPTSQYGGPPTSQYSGPPTSQYGGSGPPAGQMGRPPTSQGQFGGPPMQPGPPTSQYGAPPPSPGGPMSNRGPMSQPQIPPRRLDPDQMPSPIQVIQDDRKSHTGIFQTNARGLTPPLVSTNFTTQDQGNCNPRFMRSTMYNIPCTADMVKQCQIPIALAISPMARLGPNEQPLPLVNLGEMGPVRCNRCKAYMNPYMVFMDGGRRFQCPLCTCSTEVPPEYFAHLDHTGRRVDCYDRPELCLGSYEFVTTTDYCKGGVLPKPPAFIFMIDVSYNSVKSGLVNLICSRLKNDILVNLPKEEGMEESEVRVGFVTYSNVLHFYNVNSALAQPQMMVVSDVQDMFMPLLDGFLVKLSESEAVIESLLSQIPLMFADTRETETVLGPVVQAGLEALKAADCTGKLFIFHTTLPIGEAPGKLKNRDDRKLLGTEKEKTILTPQTAFYTKLGEECVAAGCCVDLFLFPNSYTDVATISEVSRLTSGNIFKYNYFQADLDGDRFMEDFKQTVMKPIAFDAILRIRTSTGIRPVDFLGNFFMSNTTDVELAAIDCDQSISVEIKHDDKMNEAEGAVIQVALLYTSITGQRRLRIHNLTLNCCTQMSDLFRSCELDTFINFISKSALRTTLQKTPKDVREQLMMQCANILACYRKNCASPSSAGQLILPECMKLLPVYTNCVIKSDALQGGSEISTDDRSYLAYLVNKMNVADSSVFFYPRLMPLHELDPDASSLPNAIRCSVERLQDNGVYLLENGIFMFLRIGLNVSPEWVQNVFGVQSAAQIDIDKTRLLDLQTPMSKRVRELVKKVRDEKQKYMKLTIVRQRDKLEPWFNHFLVEDKGMNGTASYVDFLCHIHKEIRNLLN